IAPATGTLEPARRGVRRGDRGPGGRRGAVRHRTRPTRRLGERVDAAAACVGGTQRTAGRWIDLRRVHAAAAVWATAQGRGTGWIRVLRGDAERPGHRGVLDPHPGGRSDRARDGVGQRDATVSAARLLRETRGVSGAGGIRAEVAVSPEVTSKRCHLARFRAWYAQYRWDSYRSSGVGGGRSEQRRVGAA